MRFCSFGSLHPRQRLLPLCNHRRVVHVICPRLATALLIAIALAAVANAEHMIRLAGAAGTALATLQFAPGLHLGDNRQHVVQRYRKLNGGRCAAKDAIRRYISCSGNFRPQPHRRRAQFAMVAAGDVVARDVEQVGNRVMDGDEAL